MKRSLYLLLIVAMVAMMGVFPATAVAAGANLVANGDFESGNSGFLTDYGFVTTHMWDPGTYGIGDDPVDYHQYWTSFGPESGNLMMVVNGSSTEAGHDPVNAANMLVWGTDGNITLPAPTLDPSVTHYTLWADNGAWNAGDVQVKVEGGTIWVRVVIDGTRGADEGRSNFTDGWLMSKLHVDVQTNCTAVPQKNGNPQPGHFKFQYVFNPGVLDSGWQNTSVAASAGVPLCIAAAADLVHPAASATGHWDYYDFCVTSNISDTDVVTTSGTQDAVVPATDPWGSLDTDVNNIPGCTDVAAYLWDAAYVTGATPTYLVGNEADVGSMVKFTQSFSIIGTPTSATLKIAADNAFAYRFNAGAVTAKNLASGWEAQVASGNFAWPSVIIDPNPSGWSTVYSQDVLSQLKPGANILNVTGLNADWNTTDPTVNPACVIYKLCGTSRLWVEDTPYIPADSETGWGDGHKFPGKNWAMCMTYTPQYAPATYTFSFWGANSYALNPAVLHVYINDVEIGTADFSTITDTGGNVANGVWKQFTFSWNAGTATTASVKMVDTCDKYSGNDLAIDNISFAKD